MDIDERVWNLFLMLLLSERRDERIKIKKDDDDDIRLLLGHKSSN